MKWEYKVLIEADNYHLRKAMNKLGEKGWEAYNVINKVYPSGDEVYIAYLKRPKREHGKRMPRYSR